MQRSEDQLLVRLYDCGDSYDARRSGTGRTLRLSRSNNRWAAGWSNGPFDQYRVEIDAMKPIDAVMLLADTIDAINALDERESSDSAAE